MRIMNGKLAIAVAATLAAFTAGAQTVPPATFTEVVGGGGGGVSGVCGFLTATDGTCQSLNGSYAHTDGGIPGTPGYDPSLDSGTHVFTGSNGLAATLSTMTYYFVVGGPPVAAGQGGAGNPAGEIAVDILSSGGASLTGNGFSFASLTIMDAGSDAGIAAGVPDPDLNKIVDSRYDCLGTGCGLAFGGNGAAWTETTQFQADHLCLTQGDMYKITITASSSSFDKGSSASAFVDPKVIVDPQGPTDPKAQCYQPTNPQDYAVSISGGASAGSVPEPETLGLLGMGIFSVGLAQGLRRRRKRA